MLESKSLHALLGNTIEVPEVDYDDEKVNSLSGDPVIDDGLQQFYFLSIIDAMGTSNFKQEYLSVIEKIKRYTTEQQQLLAFAILQNLPEKYDFEFSLNFTPYSQEDIDELYKCLEFIEYDHEQFFIEVWGYLNPPIEKLDIISYCEKNENKILKEIEEQLMIHTFSEMISNFLGTYNKENLIEWFKEKSNILRSTILISLLGKGKE